MSRIQKALEQARRHGRSVLGEDSLSEIARRRKVEVRPDLSDGDGSRVADLNPYSLLPTEDILRENRVIRKQSDGRPEVVDAYKMLRTKTLRRLISSHSRIMAVTSTTSGEGKTLTALNLSISISQDPNFDAILIDADLRAPSIHKQLGVQPEVGLSDYLEGKAELKDLIFSPGIERFGIIPNLQSVENSSEALTSSRMKKLMSDLRLLSPAVIVVVDMPPLIVDDVLAFASLIDSLMLVFRAGVTSQVDATAARELTADLPVVGCILNGAHAGSARAYY